MHKQRREFLNVIAHGSICLICVGIASSLVESCSNPEESVADSTVPLTQGDPVINLASETGLKNAGSALKKRFSSINGGRTIIVVRLSDVSFAVYAAQCTHQGGEINLPVSGTMTCPNHGSKFSASNGGVLQGPAALSLPHFTATYDSVKNTVTIS